MSQAEIATHLGVTPQRVGNWFQGRNLPRHNVVVKLARLLGVSVQFLLHGFQEESTTAVESAVGEGEQAPYGTGAEIEAEVRRNFNSLVQAAEGDPERLHWIAVQQREHLAIPRSWLKLSRSDRGPLWTRVEDPAAKTLLSTHTGKPVNPPSRAAQTG